MQTSHQSRYRTAILSKACFVALALQWYIEIWDLRESSHEQLTGKWCSPCLHCLDKQYSVCWNLLSGWESEITVHARQRVPPPPAIRTLDTESPTRFPGQQPCIHLHIGLLPFMAGGGMGRSLPLDLQNAPMSFLLLSVSLSYYITIISLTCDYNYMLGPRVHLINFCTWGSLADLQQSTQLNLSGRRYPLSK